MSVFGTIGRILGINKKRPGSAANGRVDPNVPFAGTATKDPVTGLYTFGSPSPSMGSPTTPTGLTSPTGLTEIGARTASSSFLPPSPFSMGGFRDTTTPNKDKGTGGGFFGWLGRNPEVVTGALATGADIYGATKAGAAKDRELDLLAERQKAQTENERTQLTQNEARLEEERKRREDDRVMALLQALTAYGAH